MRETDHPLRGILFVNLGLMIAACNFALIRFLEVSYSPVQVSFIRFVVMAGLVGGCMFVLGRRHLFVSKRYGYLLLVGVLAAATTLMFFFSLEPLGLDNATTLGYVGPIIVAALSGWFLGERVSAVRWAAILVGFLGVAIVMRPGAGLFNIWGFLALASAATYAVRVMVYRKLTETEDSLTILFYMSAIAALIHVPALPFVWTSTPFWELPLLFLTGLLAGATQYLLIEAYRYAAANTVVVFDYMTILYIAIVSYIVFVEIPSWNLIAGAVLLIGGGLFIVWDESRQQKTSDDERGS